MSDSNTFAQTSRKLRQLFILACLFALMVMTAACDNSTSPDTIENPPQPTATPVPITVNLPPSETALNQYLKFGRLTTEDGLSNEQLWDVVQVIFPQYWCCCQIR